MKTIDRRTDKGIILDENLQEISFAIKSLVGEIGPEMDVTFEIVMTSDGLQAVHVVQFHELKDGP